MHPEEPEKYPGYYRITSSDLPESVLYMDDTAEANCCSGPASSIGEQANWYILKNNNDTYTISNQSKLGKHMNSQSVGEGSFSCVQGNPGPQGHFIFTKVE